MQKGKMVVCGGLTNSCEKKRSEGKGEKERYIILEESIVIRQQQQKCRNPMKAIPGGSVVETSPS